MAKKAKKGDAAGIAAIRIWAMAIETAMIKRYIGNAPTLEPIKAIALRTVKEIQKTGDPREKRRGEELHRFHQGSPCEVF